MTLLVIDFDGTLCVQDAVDDISDHFDPAGFAAAATAFDAGEISLNTCLERQMAGIDRPLDELLAYMLEAIDLRDGVPELLAWCATHDVEPVVVSSGFVNLMEPFLAARGIDVPIIGHLLEETPDGLRIRFRDRVQCGTCHEPCKRSDVAALAGDRPVAYVGDGASDLCAAEVADLRFARASLARHLDRAGVAYVPFEDFHDVLAALQRHAH